MVATEDGDHRLSDETRVHFTVDSSLEYEEDGAGPGGVSHTYRLSSEHVRQSRTYKTVHTRFWYV